MNTPSRIRELLDYATSYNEFNESTPDGTLDSFRNEMNSGRRAAIIGWKSILRDIEKRPEQYGN